MSTKYNILSGEIFQILKGSGRSLRLFDEDGTVVYEPAKARRFFAEPDKMMVSIDESGYDQQVEVSLSNTVDIKEIQTLLNTLRIVVTRMGLLFGVRKYGKELTPKDFAYKANLVAEGKIFESMWGSAKTSYQRIGDCRIVIRHSARVNEMVKGGRSRYINKLFVETAHGERLKFPVNQLSGVRAWARHLAHGGSGHDEVGMKIIDLAEQSRDLKKISKYIRSNRNLSEDVQNIYPVIRDRIMEIRKTLGKLSRHRGYTYAVPNLGPDRHSEIQFDSTLISERDRLHSLLNTNSDHELSEALMTVALLTRGKAMSKIGALQTSEMDSVVEMLVDEHGFQQNKDFKIVGDVIEFSNQTAMDEAVDYLNDEYPDSFQKVAEENVVEDSAEPKNKVLAYAEKWLLDRQGGQNDVAHLTSSDRRAMDQRAALLAQGLVQFLKGTMPLTPAPLDAATAGKARSPEAQMYLKVNQILQPAAGIKNDAFYNYLSAVAEKLGAHEPLTGVEKQVANKAVELVDMPAQESIEEEDDVFTDSQVNVGDIVSTPMGKGDVVDVIQDVVKVELMNGKIQPFMMADVQVVNNEATASLPEATEIEQWFEQFNPDNFLGGEASTPISEMESDKSFGSTVLLKNGQEVDVVAHYNDDSGAVRVYSVELPDGTDMFDQLADGQLDQLEAFVADMNSEHMDEDSDLAHIIRGIEEDEILEAGSYYDQDTGTYDDAQAEQALEQVVNNFNPQEFFQEVGDDFNWGQFDLSKATSPEEIETMKYDMDYSDADILPSVEHFLRTRASAALGNREYPYDVDQAAKSLFNSEIKPLMQQAGYFSGTKADESAVVEDDGEAELQRTLELIRYRR